MASAVEDIDKGWNQIQKDVSKFKNAQVLVGFQEGTETKEEVKGDRTKAGGASMPLIAFKNEYGTDRIPKRPFMRKSYDENKALINKVFDKQYIKILDRKIKPKKALKEVGLVMVRLIQEKIETLKDPPNAPDTIALKGSSNPLIDFGQMIQSVREKVEM